MAAGDEEMCLVVGRSASGVDEGAARRVGFGSAQDLVGQRRDVSFACKKKSQSVLGGAFFGPFEVDVRWFGCPVSYGKEDGGEDVGHAWTDSA